MTLSNVPEININPEFTSKQWEAMQYLTDKTTKQLLWGGGAGGGKSHLGCTFIALCALKYPETRYVIGRTVLKSLKETTLVTLLKVLSDWDLEVGKDYTYNETNSFIKFENKSVILLKDLADNPGDPEFESLGSLEITAAFVDEMGQVSQKAFDVLFSRIRYKLEEYSLIPKLLMTCNPTKNFLYSTFYIPSKSGTLPVHRKFIQSLSSDNRFIDSNYATSLSLLDDPNLKAKLLYGDWEYSSDNTALIQYDKIQYIFRPYTPQQKADTPQIPLSTYITADIAGAGADHTVIMVWSGHTITDLVTFDTNTIPEAIQAIKTLATKYNVFASNIIVDKVGIGTGVYDSLSGCYGFVANARAINPDIYSNLKSECGYKLATLINADKICFPNCPFDFKEIIISELEQLKSDIKYLDSKKQLMSKDEIKKAIKRSPDFLDCFIFRAYFDISKRGTGKYGIGGF